MQSKQLPPSLHEEIGQKQKPRVVPPKPPDPPTIQQPRGHIHDDIYHTSNGTLSPTIHKLMQYSHKNAEPLQQRKNGRSSRTNSRATVPSTPTLELSPSSTNNDNIVAIKNTKEDTGVSSTLSLGNNTFTKNESTNVIDYGNKLNKLNSHAKENAGAFSRDTHDSERTNAPTIPSQTNMTYSEVTQLQLPKENTINNEETSIEDIGADLWQDILDNIAVSHQEQNLNSTNLDKRFLDKISEDEEIIECIQRLPQSSAGVLTNCTEPSRMSGSVSTTAPLPSMLQVISNTYVYVTRNLATAINNVFMHVKRNLATATNNILRNSNIITRNHKKVSILIVCKETFPSFFKLFQQLIYNAYTKYIPQFSYTHRRETQQTLALHNSSPDNSSNWLNKDDVEKETHMDNIKGAWDHPPDWLFGGPEDGYSCTITLSHIDITAEGYINLIKHKKHNNEFFNDQSMQHLVDEVLPYLSCRVGDLNLNPLLDGGASQSVGPEILAQYGTFICNVELEVFDYKDTPTKISTKLHHIPLSTRTVNDGKVAWIETPIHILIANKFPKTILGRDFISKQKIEDLGYPEFDIRTKGGQTLLCGFHTDHHEIITIQNINIPPTSQVILRHPVAAPLQSAMVVHNTKTSNNFNISITEGIVEVDEQGEIILVLNNDRPQKIILPLGTTVAEIYHTQLFQKNDTNQLFLKQIHGPTNTEARLHSMRVSQNPTTAQTKHKDKVMHFNNNNDPAPTHIKDKTTYLNNNPWPLKKVLKLNHDLPRIDTQKKLSEINFKNLPSILPSIHPGTLLPCSHCKNTYPFTPSKHEEICSVMTSDPIVAQYCSHLIHHYKAAFHEVNGEIGRLEAFPISFNFKEDCDEPQALAPHRLEINSEAYKALNCQIDKHINENVMKELKGPVDANIRYICPLFCIEKRASTLQDKRYRTLADLRLLNKNIQNFPTCYTESHEDIAMNLARMPSKNCSDLSDYFHSIPLTEECSNQVTVQCANRILQYLCLAQGLKISPPAAQSIATEIFADICHTVVDDLAWASPTDWQSLIIFEQILIRVCIFNLRLKLEKTHLFCQEISLLGSRISGQYISLLHRTVEKIYAIKRPTSVVQMRSLMGSLNIMKRFWPLLAEIALPLQKLLKGINNENQRKYVKSDWNETHTQCLEKIKEYLSSGGVLRAITADTAVPLHLWLDSSDHTLGYVCAQFYQEDAFLVAMNSRLIHDNDLTPNEFHPAFKEFLALKWSLDNLRPYSSCRQIIVYCDNKVVCQTQAKYQSTRSEKMLNWVQDISNYNLIVKKIPSKMNISDFLTRQDKLPSIRPSRQSAILPLRLQEDAKKNMVGEAFNSWYQEMAKDWILKQPISTDNATQTGTFMSHFLTADLPDVEDSIYNKKRIYGEQVEFIGDSDFNSSTTSTSMHTSNKGILKTKYAEHLEEQEHQIITKEIFDEEKILYCPPPQYKENIQNIASYQ